MVLIEPKFIDVNEETEKGESPPSPWNFVGKADPIIFKKINNQFLKESFILVTSVEILSRIGVQVTKTVVIEDVARSTYQAY